MSSRKWAGRKVTTARSQMAVRLPLPCTKCGRAVLPTQRWQVDHIVPRWAGGGDEPSNLGPAHGKCNESDGGKTGARITNARKASTIKRMDSERSRKIRGIY